MYSGLNWLRWLTS